MKIYKCKISFSVDNYDEDGFLIENEATIVEEGRLYQLDESGSTIIGGEVHLDSVDGKSWLELSKDALEELFEEVER